MTKVEKKEHDEIKSLVHTLMNACRTMANKKAERYEREFLNMVKEELDKEIETRNYVYDTCAEIVGQQIKSELQVN